jgi:hypothetical protein
MRVGGLEPAMAERVIAHRPYFSTDDLVTRGILDRDTYAAVGDRLAVGPPGMPDYLDAVPPMPRRTVTPGTYASPRRWRISAA